MLKKDLRYENVFLKKFSNSNRTITTEIVNFHLLFIASNHQNEYVFTVFINDLEFRFSPGLF